jgi:hypothetical protein
MLKLRRDKPGQAGGMAGGRRGGGDVDDAQRLVRLPSAPVTPDTFVSPAGNESVDTLDAARESSSYPPFVCSPEDVDESAGARSEYELEQARIDAFHRLVANPVWNPHQPRPQRSAVEGDWWLQS